ncbi:hypothetical protein N7491_009135 [Penicillium cf. griseofulvum]|uniref:Uncharacterized protein n=1 Tax=Penicillium cf. griseofulvum TaxID=2972120 RepID=A0A9W9MF04_9EURO|nr:hypothetical protein N7472_005269 [Penicillium cf. griseofulvum]KAJ5423919.1 hypothetical protein N7491_009135 [Penicillium cf. griseofulvum]
MEPARPPRLDGSSPAPIAITKDDESIVAHAFVDDQLVAGGPNRKTQEKLAIIRSSTESDNNLHEGFPPPLLASTSQFAAPVNSRDLTVSQTIGSNISYAEWSEHQPLDGIDPDFICDTPNRVQRPETAHQAEERRARWVVIENLINNDDTAMAQMLSSMCPFDMFPIGDFYIRYIRVAWMCGLDTMTEARSRLNSKLLNHGRYLEEVNEAIALDPHISPGDARYDLRVYNINERARVLNALDEHDMLMQYTETIDMDNINDSGGIVVDPEHQNPVHIEGQLERMIAGGSYVNLSTDGTNEFERANTNRGVDIIDPDTGYPIEFQRQSFTTANNSSSNGTGRTNENNSDFNNVQVDGSSDLLICDHENDSTSRRASLFNEIQVDRRSELWARDRNETSGNVPTGSNDPSFDADSRLGIRISPGMGSGVGTDEIISWIPQETWTERRPRNGRRTSGTVPRNFGRNNVFNYRSPLHSITEINHDEHAIELASTTATNGSPTPSLMFSPNADEMYHPTGDAVTQNEPCDASVSAGSDDRQQMIRDSSPEPGLTEEMLSTISLEQQRRSAGVLENFFDMFVLDVQGDWEAEGSGERGEHCSAEQPENSMNRRRNGSITLTMNGFDYTDEMSDTPLLLRNNPFGRHSPFGMNSSLSRNSPSRVISRSGDRRRYDIPVGGLSSVGSRMIASSLNARRRHDARENVRNARRSLINSRLIDDLRDRVPVTTVLGFDEPDSQRNTNYSPLYPRLINASLRHTAPAIVNTSRINAHAHR